MYINRTLLLILAYHHHGSRNKIYRYIPLYIGLIYDLTLKRHC